MQDAEAQLLDPLLRMVARDLNEELAKITDPDLRDKALKKAIAHFHPDKWGDLPGMQRVFDKLTARLTSLHDVVQRGAAVTFQLSNGTFTAGLL